jgi:hypothetical protein
MLLIGVLADIAAVLGLEWAFLTLEAIVYLDDGLRV